LDEAGLERPNAWVETVSWRVPVSPFEAQSSKGQQIFEEAQTNTKDLLVKVDLIENVNAAIVASLKLEKELKEYALFSEAEKKTDRKLVAIENEVKKQIEILYLRPLANNVKIYRELIALQKKHCSVTDTKITIDTKPVTAIQDGNRSKKIVETNSSLPTSSEKTVEGNSK
jgi:hypothetical protein